MKTSTHQTTPDYLKKSVDLPHNAHAPAAENILQHFVVTDAHSPLSYITDFRRNKYVFIGASCKRILGYEPGFLLAAGPAFVASLWHTNDLKIYTENILPLITDFLKTHTESDCADYSFSYNYRIKAIEDAYVTVLQHSTFLMASNNKNPVAVADYIFDITHFKEDSKIIFTIEKTGKHFGKLPAAPVFKSMYFPDRSTSVLSRREREILQLIYTGAGSKQIAAKLCISINTINNHRKNMLKKTGSKNFVQLFSYAVANNIIN